MTDGGLIEVRVAVNMAGARLGHTRWVDPEDPYIAERLTLGYLVRVSPEVDAVDAEADAVSGDGAETAAPVSESE